MPSSPDRHDRDRRKPVFHFDDQTFDPATGELSGPAGAARLAPKPARLLTMFLEAGGELVGRESIREALWPDTTVDFDAGLHSCVRQVRNALRDVGGDPDRVETLARRGYRIKVGGRAHPPSRGARSRRFAAAFVVVAFAAMIGWLLWPVPDTGPAPDTGSSRGPSGAGPVETPTTPDPALGRPARLAVVPFVDPLTDDHAAFNRDLTEAFVAALVAIAPDELAVIGPATTASHFSGGDALADVAAAVDADFVLHGGHRSGAGIVFVEVVLPDGAHLYAQRMPLDPDAVAEAPPDVVAAMTASILEAFADARVDDGSAR